MKILIIGLGSIGKKHVDGILNHLPDSEIFALRTSKSDDTYRNVKNIYSKSQIPQDIAFAIISNITASHSDSIVEMLPFGCPLFIEKPVLANVDTAEQISKQLSNTGVKTYIACNMRFHPAIEFIKNDILNSGCRINEVNIYCGSYLPNWRPGKDFRTIYSANKSMGGGVHLDLIHELDYCCWLFGFPSTVQSLQTSKSSLNIDAIDSARYLFAYNGFNLAITLNYFRRDAKRQIEIVTSEDTLIIDLLSNEVTSKLGGNLLFKSDIRIVDTYTRQMEYFVDQIKAGKELMNNFDFAINVLKLAINE